MKSTRNLDAIVTTASYNKIFNTLYQDFESQIYLKIKNKTPEPETWKEFIAAGFKIKPSYFVSTVYYMRVELTAEHVQELRDTILSELYPVIRKLSNANIEIMLRTTLESISKKILQMDLISFDGLIDTNFRDMLLACPVFMKAARLQNIDIDNLLNSLMELREQYNLEYKSSMSSTMFGPKASLWVQHQLKKKEQEREIESQFALSSIKLT